MDFSAAREGTLAKTCHFVPLFPIDDAACAICFACLEGKAESASRSASADRARPGSSPSGLHLSDAVRRSSPRRWQIAVAEQSTPKSMSALLEGSGTVTAAVTMIVMSPLVLERALMVVEPGPLILKLKNVSFPVGSRVGIGVPPDPV